MRPVLLALLVSAALAPRAAADLRPFDDAPLHAVQFVDEREGWAVGDDGVIWHTINGGKEWERQPTGVRASLRSLHFLNPYTGWVAGREELSSGGSAGVLMFTKDGGVKWQRVTLNALPGLNKVRFLDSTTGYLAGDGTEPYPSGVFVTTDAGRTWAPLAGKRTTSWLAADFYGPQAGALGGVWNRLASVNRDTVIEKDLDSLGGRALRGLSSNGKTAVAVGQGGVVFINDDTRAAKWELADLRTTLPADAQAACDFHAVSIADRHVWVVGRPGTTLLHSGNRGATWEVVRTRQPLPLNGVFFLDEKHGWAVGELGAILATTDGGKTWAVQRRGGERVAVLFVHARPGGVPLETVAGLGGDEGYLVTALRVAASDPTTAAAARATEAMRFAVAVRRAGGASGETLWQFPLPQHAADCNKEDLLKGWDGRHGGRAADELLRQLVLALRVWRPEVVITDADANGPALDNLVAEAMKAAFARAADPKAFPEQIEALGLAPWKAAKLYARREQRGTGTVVYDASEPAPRLEASPRDFATPAAALVPDAPEVLPAQRFYALLDGRLDGAADHKSLMQGVTLAPRGEARRDLGEVAALPPEVQKAIQTRRNLQALADMPSGGLADPNRLLAQIAPAIDAMPADQGAPAAFALAGRYARAGQWSLAREVYGLVLERYPAHPLAAEACRWLVRHSASGEARRRLELGQYVALSTTSITATPKDRVPGTTAEPKPKNPKATGPLRFETKVDLPQVTGSEEQEAWRGLSGSEELRQWHAAGLKLESRLSAFGPLFGSDPATLLCLNASRRQLGDFDGAKTGYQTVAARQAAGPWRDAALTEMWLLNRSGEPPKPALACRLISQRPFLDGKLDDACWQGVKPTVLKPVGPPRGDDLATEVFLAYDREYLYLGLRCRLPAERHVAPVKVRPRDADLRPYDRVGLMLDVDRDYTSCFHLEVDQRGCVHEGFCQDGVRDPSWNPRWFVACHSEPGVWQIEAALPLVELTGDPVTLGKAWACNVVRVVPGRGVQAASLPADAEPRPEGMGLLMFTADGRRDAPMPREP